MTDIERIFPSLVTIRRMLSDPASYVLGLLQVG
jgi:hypothetical protein